MNDTLTQLRNMMTELADLRAFYGEETGRPKELIAFLRKARDQARALAKSLFFDKVLCAVIADQLETLALAADLCLKTYSADDGDLTPSVYAILTVFESGNPWPAAEPGSLAR